MMSPCTPPANFVGFFEAPVKNEIIQNKIIHNYSMINPKFSSAQIVNTVVIREKPYPYNLKFNPKDFESNNIFGANAKSVQKLESDFGLQFGRKLVSPQFNTSIKFRQSNPFLPSKQQKPDPSHLLQKRSFDKFVTHTARNRTSWKINNLFSSFDEPVSPSDKFKKANRDRKIPNFPLSNDFEHPKQHSQGQMEGLPQLYLKTHSVKNSLIKDRNFNISKHAESKMPYEDLLNDCIFRLKQSYTQRDNDQDLRIKVKKIIDDFESQLPLNKSVNHFSDNYC